MVATSIQERIKKIRTLKESRFGTVFVDGHVGRRLLRLDLLTASSVNNAHIIRLLSRWRKKHQQWFPSQFPITSSRTRVWLQHRVIDEPDRLLFMIHLSGTYRGHVGLYRFTSDYTSCEIDNILRGRVGGKGMMEESIRRMMDWGMQTLGIRTYTLQTTSDNVRAIALYARIGFREIKRVGLVYKKTSDGGEWQEAPKRYTGHIKKYDIFMKWEGLYEEKQ